MDERLSSKFTFFYKFIFTPLWIGGFGFGTFAMFLNPHAFKGDMDVLEVRFIFLFAWLIGSSFIYWACGRLKKVERQGHIMRISNYFQAVEVPLTEVESVSGSILMSPELIWITFYRPTIFGSKIVFMPKWRLLSGWTRNPLVAQLQEEIAKLRGSVV